MKQQPIAGKADLLDAIRILFYICYIVFILISVDILHIDESGINLGWIIYTFCWYIFAELILFIKNKNGVQMRITDVFTITFVFVVTENLLSVINYEHLGIINRVEHLLGIFAIAFMTRKLFIALRWKKLTSSRLFFNLSVFTATTTFGIGNEVLEYLSDTYLQTHHITSIYDTGIDLLVNSIGAAIFTIYLFLSKK